MLSGDDAVRPLRPRAERLSLCIAAALLSLSGLAPLPASAQPTGKRTDEDEAARLFAEGREALTKKDHVTACARFRSSLELVTRPNTLFNVAQCDEREGKIAAALGRWQQGVAVLGEGDERVAIARERIAALDPKVPRVTVKLAAGAPEDARVLADGAPMKRALLGTPIPMEIGSHSFVVEAPGRKPAREEITLAEGDRKEIEIAPGPAEPGGGGSGSGGTTPPPPPSGSTLRTLGFVAGGIGIAGFIAAGVTGGLLLAKDSSIREGCPTPDTCTPKGYAEIEGTGTLLVVNTIGWAAGVAGVGAGVVLLLVSGRDSSGTDAKPPTTAVAPFVFPGAGGVTVTGRF
jgi:hypothetical protein